MSPYFQRKIDDAQTGGNREGLAKKNMELLLIPLPPIQEQKRITKKIKELLEIHRSLEQITQDSKNNGFQLIESVLNETLRQRNITPALNKSNPEYTANDNKALILAAEIIWQLHNTQTLGHVKLQKLIFLCNKMQNISLSVNFLKQAMGPYDPKLQRYLDAELEKMGWFKYDEVQMLKYQPLANAGGHKLAFKAQFGEQVESIYHLIQLFEDTNSARIEIVATLFACWEEMILDNQLVNDESLLKRFYDWSEFKGNYSNNQVKSALRWMESNGIVPQG
jgi:type I restriction enzyme S subunit